MSLKCAGDYFSPGLLILRQTVLDLQVQRLLRGYSAGKPFCLMLEGQEIHAGGIVHTD